jgi:hypothetical protein
LHAALDASKTMNSALDRIGLGSPGSRARAGQPESPTSGAPSPRAAAMPRDAWSAPQHAQAPHDQQHRAAGSRPPATRIEQEHAPLRDFPANHRDRPLFDAVRAQLPKDTSVEVAANAVLQIKEGGLLRPDQIKSMAVRDDQLFVVGKVPGFHSVTDLTQKPQLEQTLQQIGQVNQQQDAQRQQWAQQLAQEQSQGRGTSR